MGTATLTDVEFIEKYRRLCGHIAWDFVRRSHREVSPITLTQEDAEDFASCALLKLAKYYLSESWAKHGDNKWYVQRIIENAITTAWRKRLKQMGQELDKVFLRRYGYTAGGASETGSVQIGGAYSEGHDIFDELPGPDGLAGKTQLKFDSAKMLAIIPTLPNAERIVVELTFGLNGAESFSRKRIAKKLGRTEWWTESKLKSAILRMRSQISSQQPSLAVS